MSIFTEIAITILAAALVAMLLWKFYAFMLTPVKLGQGAHVWTVLKIDGECTDIEQTVDGLLWLYRNGILRSKVLIVDCNMNVETRELAEIIVKRHGDIALCDIKDFVGLLGES